MDHVRDSYGYGEIIPVMVMEGQPDPFHGCYVDQDDIV